MAKVNITLSNEAELGLIKIENIAKKNGLHHSTKGSRIELAIKWGNEFLDKLDAESILNITGLKR